MTTNYSHFERIGNHWMCADGALIQEPLVEATPQRRRMRIAGHNETFPRGELSGHLYRWVLKRARARETWPVLKLPHDPETEDPAQRLVIIRSQVERFEPKEGFEPFTRNARVGEANWLFRHRDLPIHARVMLQVVVEGASNARVECSIKFPNLTRGGDDAFGRYDRRQVLDNGNSKIGETWRSDEVQSILGTNDMNLETLSYPNVSAAMTDAIRRYRQIDALAELRVPDLRGVRVDGEGPISVMTLGSPEAQQPNSFLNEMQEFAERLAPADEIVEHWKAIVGILNGQGVPINAPTAKTVLDILAGKDGAPINLHPLRHRAGGTEQDRDHTVTLDLHSGIVHVGCNVRETDLDRDLLAYELARTRAEITGEVDLMDAFLASMGRTRADLERLDIIESARPRREA